MIWVQSIAQPSKGYLVSTDGNKRAEVEKGTKAIIHMVSAWSNENNMVLGPLKVNDKSK